MGTIATGIILASILGTITLSICLSFDEAFGNWHVKPVGWHRWHRWYRRHRIYGFGMHHGRHRIHKRDIKPSLGNTKELNIQPEYKEIIENQNMANSYIAKNANINFSKDTFISNNTRLESINNVIDFAKSDVNNNITIS